MIEQASFAREGTQLDINVYPRISPARAIMMSEIIEAARGLMLEPLGFVSKHLLSGLSGNYHG